MTPDSLSIAKEEQKGWSRQDIDYVPVLDLADYLEGKPDAFEKLVEELRFAQENIGFYYITNHGVDQALIDETFHQVARFHALPLERKLEIRIDTDVTGYFPIGGGGKIKDDGLSGTSSANPNAGKVKPDRSEALMIRRERTPDDPEYGLQFRAPNKWPNALPGFREVLVAYMNRMEKLGQKLLPIYAAALGKAPDFFNDKFDRADISSRFGHYPPGDGNDPNEFGAAPHADAGFLTLLPQAAVPGLEIATQSGKWIPAPVRPGEILVNGGRLLVRFSNGRFLATPHRVLASLPCDRYSIPLFYNPNFDTVIEPLDTCVSAERPARFDPVTYFQHMVNFFSSNLQGFAKSDKTADPAPVG